MDIDLFLERNKARLDRLYCGKEYAGRYRALAKEFEKRFGTEPQGFISAPGRTEVIGNHTDHNFGRVLAAAVNLDTVCALRARSDMRVRLYSAGYSKPFDLDLSDLSAQESEKFTTYSLIRGVAARLDMLGRKIGGFDCCVQSTVFKGSGLSSSAAIEVMLVAAFDYLYNGFSIDAETNARISQYTENKYFGKPSGLMDQAASAFGGLVFIDFANGGAKVENLKYDFDAKGYKVLVVSVGGEHGSLTSEYAAIPAEMKAVAAAMGKNTLSEITKEEFESALGSLKGKVKDRALLRAFHFLDETERVPMAVQALKDDDAGKFMKYIIESGESSWKLLQNLFVAGSDNQEMPLALEMSRRKLEGRGAWRIHGGGFAGTILAFVPTDALDEYVAQMEMVFGKGAATVLSIRPEGVVALD